MNYNKRALGLEYEQRAADYLSELGYRIIQKNYRCRYGEIDLIAEHEGYLVFVEVKFREGKMKGLPEEAVNLQKQRKICMASAWYRMRYSVPEDRPMRFDVVAICKEEVRVVQNAFEYRL